MPGGSSGLSSSFAKVSFVADGEQIDMEDPDFWRKILPADESQDRVGAGLGRRQPKQLERCG